MKLKDNIKARRLALGLTLDEVAQKIGVSKPTIHRYESGVITNIPSDKLLKIADALQTTPALLNGWNEPKTPSNAIPYYPEKEIPIVGSIRAGYNSVAYGEEEGCGYADVKDPENYFFLRIKGDSMEPRIFDGDLALIRKQPDVENGELAAVIINGDEGTLKKVIKHNGTLVLQAFNSSCPPLVLSGTDLEFVRIVGKVIKTETIW